MKMLTWSLLVCGVMALTTAAAVPGAELGEWTGSSVEEGGSHIVKRSASCPWGWTACNGRCFLYVPTPMTWANAEKNCQYRGGHLASVHNVYEHFVIQVMIQRLTHSYPLTWLGGSKQKGTWFWSDGTPFRFNYWSPGQPGSWASPYCLLMNFGALKKFDDQPCCYKKPFVCARKP